MNIKFEVTNLTRKHLVIALVSLLAVVAVVGVSVYAVNREPTTEELMADARKSQRDLEAQRRAERLKKSEIQFHKVGRTLRHSSLFETELDYGASITPWFRKA